MTTFFRWRPHPWHGLESGPNPPEIVQAWIEITPFDLVKYEVDKSTGYLRVDRPQRTSSSPPTLYGFIPRTYCGDRVGALSKEGGKGDGDPLDICVFSERPINRSEVLVTARVVGGIRAIDHGEADDKIIAVLDKDPVWGEVRTRNEWLAARMQTRVYHALLVHAGAHFNNGQSFASEQIEMIYWFADFPNEPARFAYTSAQYKRDWDTLFKLADEIASASSYPLTDDRTKCSYCPYRSYCDRGVRAGDVGDVETEMEAEESFDVNFEQIGDIAF